MVEEERLNGEKHTAVFPQLAVDHLLGRVGLTAADIAVVAYGFDGRRYLDALPATDAYLRDPLTAARAQPRADSFRKVHGRFGQRMGSLRAKFPRARVAPVLHHRAHALYAFASSPYEHAAVLIADSLGEVQTTSIGIADRHRVPAYRMVEAIDDPASLGYAYGAVTEHLGWRRGDEEGTVMALAALGDPGRFRDLLAEAIPLTDTGFAVHPGLFPLRVLAGGWPRVSEEFITRTCPPRAADQQVEPVHADLAAAMQERTEIVLDHLARRAKQLTGARLLCVGGGVAANCVAIGKIIESGVFDEVHVPPAPGDAGTAVGAAISVALDARGSLPTRVAGHCYLGPAYSRLTLPEQPRPGLHAQRCDDPAGQLARALADGLIVGLFHGPLEVGPRALGNRSILASPLKPDVADRLNAEVKFREPFRPFAPVVLAEAAGRYFTLGQPAPYMSAASGVTDGAREHIGAVVHANGTARLQTVTAGDNPFLHRVLVEFALLTGVPVLINTSLNVKGKPMCGTPDMALDCLAESGLDALLIEGWWVTKC